MTRTIKRLVSLLAAGTVLALGATGMAQASDYDGDGLPDVLVREYPNMPYINVGARCDLTPAQGGGWNLRLRVRPPWVASLWGLQSQQVAWRAAFYNASTGSVLAQSPWTPGTATHSSFTDFGANVPSGTMIAWAQYWNQSHSFTYQRTLGYIKAYVEVAWYDPWSATWVIRSVPIQWYLTSQNLAASTDRFSGC